MVKGKLSKREELFCYYYARLGNGREAAVRAGYPALLAEKRAALLLLNRAVREEVARRVEAEEQRKVGGLTLQGLARLAFGGVNDAVNLILREGGVSAEELAGLDLFAISEIKQVKGGGFEIKFFDRLKALELMLGYGQKLQGQPQADSFYQALEKGAAAVAGLAGDGCEI